MANLIRIKRRLAGGAAGAPSGLANAELAFNEVDSTLYYGVGTGGAGGTATSILAIAGPGAFVDRTSAQTVSGAKTWTGANDFSGGSVLVPTVATSDSSSKAASTSFVAGYAQPLTSALTAFAAMVTVGILVQTAAGAYAARSLAGTAGRIVLSNPAGTAGNPTFDLASGIIAAPGSFPKVTVDTYGRVTAGSALSSGDVTTGLGYTPENPANKGVANGYASLDSGGLVPLSQLPAAVTGGMNYVGTWNASTNTPTLANGTGTKGYYYKVSTAGNTVIDGNGNWTVGDLIVFDGTTWDKVEGGSPDVLSVAGRVGAIVLTTADIGGLGTIATQNANNVNITGGLIDVGVTINANAANVTGIVAAANGGTGQSSYTIGDILQASSGTALSKLNAVAAGNVLLSGGVATANAWGKVGLTTHVTGTLAATNGGTGFAAYTIGDLLYASSTTALAKLSAVAAGNVLISAGTGTAPAWGQVSLTTSVSGTLPVANGGTGVATLAAGYVKSNGTAAFTSASTIPITDVTGTATVAQGGTGFSSYTIGDMLQASATGTLSKLASVATGNVLLSGGVGAVNAWGKVGLTTHVTGTLPVANGGTGLTSYAVGDLLYASAAGTLASLADVAVGNVLLSGGVGAAPTYGKVALGAAVSGTLPVANGGTGVGTLTGYVYGNGTGVMTASTTIPNTAITGLGTMSTQNASAVAITGGTIDGVTLDGGTY